MCLGLNDRELITEPPHGTRAKTNKRHVILTVEVSKGKKIRNRYNQVPHLTQYINGKVTLTVRHHK